MQYLINTSVVIHIDIVTNFGIGINNIIKSMCSEQNDIQYQEGGRLMAIDHVDSPNELTLLPTLGARNLE